MVVPSTLWCVLISQLILGIQDLRFLHQATLHDDLITVCPLAFTQIIQKNYTKTKYTFSPEKCLDSVK